MRMQGVNLSDPVGHSRSTDSETTIDREEVIRAAQLLIAPGGITEVRALDATIGGSRYRGIVSGYFDSSARLADAISRIMSAKGIYVVLNEVNPALLSRACNRIRIAGKEPTTSDHDILRRRWLPIDVDPVRPAGISSTDAEKALAVERAKLVEGHLHHEGWPAPVLGDSGNGAHLLYRIDLPPSDDGLVRRILEKLAGLFDDEHVKIDTGIHNPARIWKLYGTWACKGDSTDERPHRMARLLSIPETVALVPDAILREFGRTDSRVSIPSSLRGDFDLDGWIARYLPDAEGPKAWKGGGAIWTLPTCPWNPDHTGGCAFVGRLPDGAIVAGCHHNSCTWNWRELRERFELEHGSTNADDSGRGSDSRSASRLHTVRLADVEPESVDWLWPQRIPRGKVTLLYGDPGLGKSFLTMDLAARTSTGCGWPDAPGVCHEPGGVLLLTAEDGLADTVRPRLDAAGADVSRIEAIESVGVPGGGERAPNLANDLRLIEERIVERGDVRLFICDPISAYCGKADSHTNAEVRGLLAPIAKLAERHGVAVVAVSHLNKGAGGRAMYRAMGSLAFIAAARAGWLVVEDESDPRQRLMLPTKMNLAARPSGMAFTLRDTGMPGGVPCVSWGTEPVELSADEALAMQGGNDQRTKREEAAEWLRFILADGPVPAKEVQRDASQNCISTPTLRRAMSDADVESVKLSFSDKTWYWRIKGDKRPPRCSPKGQDAHASDVSALGMNDHLGSEAIDSEMAATGLEVI